MARFAEAPHFVRALFSFLFALSRLSHHRIALRRLFLARAFEVIVLMRIAPHRQSWRKGVIASPVKGQTGENPVTDLFNFQAAGGGKNISRYL